MNEILMMVVNVCAVVMMVCVTAVVVVGTVFMLRELLEAIKEP